MLIDIIAGIRAPTDSTRATAPAPSRRTLPSEVARLNRRYMYHKSSRHPASHSTFAAPGINCRIQLEGRWSLTLRRQMCRWTMRREWQIIHHRWPRRPGRTRGDIGAIIDRRNCLRIWSLAAMVEKPGVKVHCRSQRMIWPMVMECSRDSIICPHKRISSTLR